MTVKSSFTSARSRMYAASARLEARVQRHEHRRRRGRSPSAAIAHSVVFGAQIETRSPGSMPDAISARAGTRRRVGELARTSGGPARRPAPRGRRTAPPRGRARAGIVCGRSASVTFAPVGVVQRPSKSGSRRSLRARANSWKSADRLDSSIASASSARWRSRSTVRLRCTSSLVSPTATVAAPASSATSVVGDRGDRLRRRRRGARDPSPRPRTPGDLAAEHQHLLGPGHADEARDEPRRAGVGGEAHAGERRAQAGVVGDDREVGRRARG